MLEIEGYHIKELVHQGRPFLIYRGQSAQDKKNVVLKLTSKKQATFQDLSAIQHEHKILSQINLPGVVKVLDLIWHENKTVLVLEDIKGATLRQYLSQNKMDLNAFFIIALQLIDTLSALHHLNISHKNINPDNIMIQSLTGPVKLIDFRMATQVTTQEHFQNQYIDGSLSYISPEQTGRTNRAVDYRTDFYSLGVTFYEMLTQRLPFLTQDPLELVHCHLAIKPEPVITINQNVPEQISRIIDKLLAKIPEERYSSAAGLKADLEECKKQWQMKQQIDLFPLGQQDTYEHLTFSQKLYGREDEIKQLLSAFERVSKGTAELLLISGYSGIGKTTLVKEIYKPLNLKRGYFASGKYDQLQRATPYSAFFEAFEELVRHILSDSEVRLAEIKASLVSALGNNGQVMVDVVPNLVSIIGPQPPVVRLSSIESKKRFMITFQNFVVALAGPSRPLAIFLDDLQWIDSASLQLIEALFQNPDLKYFLLIGGYRDNEVQLDHPLLSTLTYLKKTNVPISTLSLPPLQEQDIQSFLSDSLNTSKRELEQLVNLIMKKTQGNPFFVNIFVKKLYEDKLMVFSYEERSWKWNIAEIEKQNITDNVVALLIQRLSFLPEKTRHILELAACVGHTFDFNTLITISTMTSSETAKYMLEAIQLELISAVTVSYHSLELLVSNTVSAPGENIIFRFMHDRIQQAAYQLIPTDTKQFVHLTIGRLLLKEKALDENGNRIFDVLNHFNQGISLITEQKECDELAQYNLLAGEKAKTANAYEAAKKYLNAGLQLLEKNKNASAQGLYSRLNKELAICHYLTGNFSEAETIFKTLIKESKEILSKMELYKLYCEMLATQNKHHEALQLGIKALKGLNIHIPAKPNKLQVLWSIIKVKLQIGRKKISTLSLLPITSKTHRVCLELMSQMLNSAFITDQNLFVILVCTNMRLYVKYGFIKSATFDSLVYAFTLMHALNEYASGLEVVKLYDKLTQEFGEGANRGKNSFILGSFILPWTVSLDQSITYIFRGYQSCCEVGDLPYANYCFVVGLYTIFMVGKPFDELSLNVKNATAFLNKNNIYDFKQLTLFWEDILEYITTDTFGLEKLHAHEKNILAVESKTEMGVFYSLSVKLCYLFGFYEEVKKYSAKRNAYSEYLMGMVFNVEGFFYQALAIAGTSTLKTYQSDLRIIKKIRSKINNWALWCPDNYQQYLLILDAEIARINNQITVAGQLYKQAILIAGKQHFTSVIAIANERAGLLWMSIGFLETAAIYLQHAHYHYQVWGLTAKCRLLEKQFPDWLSGISAKLIGESIAPLDISTIDVSSILKVNQAILSEINLDKLLQKLIDYLLQNAGADRAVVFSKINEMWYVEADGTSKQKYISLSQNKRAQDSADIPLSLISYVQRTKEILLVQDVNDWEKYTKDDPYLANVKPQSILILPIFLQQELRNILYLENKLTNHAFTVKHINTLQLLASQAVISIENARLASESEMRKRLIFDKTMISIIIIDETGKIMELNQAAESLFNYETDDLVGKDIADIILLPSKRASFHKSLANYTATQSDPLIGQLLELVTKQRQGNDLFLEATIIPYHSFSGVLSFICFFFNITERVLSVEKINKLNSEMLTIARKAGMAEVAANVLHNVGNVLNSVNISSTLVKEYLDRSELDTLSDVCKLLDENKQNLGDYITKDAKGVLIPEYLKMMVAHWTMEKRTILKELTTLSDNINHIKNILTVQQTLDKVSGFKETISIKEVIEEAIALSGVNLTNITLNKFYQEMNKALVDKVKLIQILINLFKNAKDAVIETNNIHRIVAIHLTAKGNRFRITVSDNGIGISKENLTKIFAHGFTTKKKGHGFGLHASAIAAREMGGELSAESNGPGTGSVFILELPMNDVTNPGQDAI